MKIVITILAALLLMGHSINAKSDTADVKLVCDNDTIPCKVVQISEKEFNKTLENKFLQAKIIEATSFFHIDSYGVNFLQYHRSSGHYVFIKVSIDSLGNYLSHEIKRNFEPSLGNKKYKKVTKNIRALNYNSMFAISEFLATNCYVSDGSELIVISKTPNGILGGAIMVDLMQNLNINKTLCNFITNAKQL